MSNEIEKLKRQIEIKDKYLQLILDIGFDYDGFTNANDLKILINELCNYASKALKNDDKSIMYFTERENFNILGERAE